MITAGTLRQMGRGLLAAACGLVLMLQLMATAVAASSHLAIKFDVGEIALTEICGTTPDSKRPPAAHVEGVNTCCVWAKSVALAPLVPPAPTAMVHERAGSAPVIFIWQSEPLLFAEPQGPPRATGPPLRS